MLSVNQKEASEAKLKLSSESGDGWVEIMLPVLTVSEANGGAKKVVMRKGKRTAKAEHWTDKHARHKRQKGMVSMMLRRHSAMLSVPCHITLTRYAPHKLDRHDNLPMSLKWILDACCAIITGDYRPGRADDSEEIDVTYKQEISSQYGVRIFIKLN